MPLFSIRITYDNDTEATAFYRLSHLSEFMKKHPLKGKRGCMPLLPWLLDMAWDKIGDDRVDGKVQRIDIEEQKS